MDRCKLMEKEDNYEFEKQDLVTLSLAEIDFNYFEKEMSRPPRRKIQELRRDITESKKFRNPLTVWEHKGVLSIPQKYVGIDGHTRTILLREKNIKQALCLVKHYDSLEEARRQVWEINRIRRQMKDFELLWNLYGEKGDSDPNSWISDLRKRSRDRMIAGTITEEPPIYEEVGVSKSNWYRGWKLVETLKGKYGQVKNNKTRKPIEQKELLNIIDRCMSEERGYEITPAFYRYCELSPRQGSDPYPLDMFGLDIHSDRERFELDEKTGRSIDNAVWFDPDRKVMGFKSCQDNSLDKFIAEALLGLGYEPGIAKIVNQRKFYWRRIIQKDISSIYDGQLGVDSKNDLSDIVTSFETSQKEESEEMKKIKTELDNERRAHEQTKHILEGKKRELDFERHGGNPN
ncbi:MAG: hypothetical protein ACYCQJ_10420 [Nitrososphaerales archaeon]